MPTQLAPIALAALVPLLFMVLFLGVRILLIRRSERQTRGQTVPEPAVRSAATESDSVVVVAPLQAPATIGPWQGAEAARPVAAPTLATLIAPAPAVPASPRKVDHQLASRYARPAMAGWRAWSASWLDAAPATPDPTWIESVVASFLALARPIVIAMDPDPDSPDADAAARAVRAIYLHPERHVLIEGRWFVVEAPASGQTNRSPGQRWQMGPAAAGDPGGHTLVVPTPRAPLVHPFADGSGPDVVQALTIEGLIETTGIRSAVAAQTVLGWAGLEDITDDQVIRAVSDAARITRALGVAS